MLARAARNLARAPSIPHLPHVPPVHPYSFHARPIAFRRTSELGGPSVTRRLAHTYARFPGDPHAKHDHPDPNRPPYTPESAPPPRPPPPPRRRVAFSSHAPRRSSGNVPLATTRVDGTTHPPWVSTPFDDKPDSESTRRLWYLLRLGRADQRRLLKSRNRNEVKRMKFALVMEIVMTLIFVWFTTTFIYGVVGTKPVLFWAQDWMPAWLRSIMRNVWKGYNANARHLTDIVNELVNSVPPGERRTMFQLKLYNDFNTACERIEKRGITPQEWEKVREWNLALKDVMNGRFERELERIAADPNAQPEPVPQPEPVSQPKPDKQVAPASRAAPLSPAQQGLASALGAVAAQQGLASALRVFFADSQTILNAASPLIGGPQAAFTSQGAPIVQRAADTLHRAKTVVELAGHPVTAILSSPWHIYVIDAHGWQSALLVSLLSPHKLQASHLGNAYALIHFRRFAESPRFWDALRLPDSQSLVYASL